MTGVPPPRRSPSVWKYVGGLAPAIVLWAVLVGWLAMLLYRGASWPQEADRANVREWLDEARTFRKTLPELVKEYVAVLEETPRGPNYDTRAGLKAEELAEHMRALAEPTRVYQGQLPLFPEVYKLAVDFPGLNPPQGDAPKPVVWESALPEPRQQSQTKLRCLEYQPLGAGDDRAVIRCWYRLHAFNKLQRDEERARAVSLVAGGVLVTASVLALLVVYRFLKREREGEVRQLEAAAAVEHREREKEELKRQLLEQELEAAKLEGRASQAERAALEMKSQLYASIGIMAGSYAHNIKNLLVRPNDLLSRCIEADGMTGEQEGMLQEVKSTLGTVTERLQQILRTVRRDPSKAEMTRVDLNELVRETERTWAELGREKWKLRVAAETCDGPLPVSGDLSHLQQAVENLLFNARDATFEMRNHLREEARKATGADRRQQLLDAAGWKGEVTLRTRRDGDFAVLEVRDNGIGMTPEVREHCRAAHFSTKRDNALYAGYSAGMGLGLSFVAVVLEHHGAALEIESEPLTGAMFRVRFPVAEPDKAHP